jgi:hypothetical protein
MGEENPAKHYKKQIKELNKIDLRRSNKFDTLCVFGAIHCLKNLEYKKNIDLFIGSEYGAISGVVKVLESLNEEPYMIMPFDFLNMNGNNACFFISKALELSGENFLTVSNGFSFEKALQHALFNSSIKENFFALIGGVDESIKDIENTNTYDGSSWLYCSNNKQNAIAEISSIKEFSDEDELKQFLNFNNEFKIYLNYIASKKLKIENSFKYKNEFYYGSQTSFDIIELIFKNEDILYISQNRSNNFIVIEIKKIIDI